MLLARGELIACVDADVYAEPDWLEQLVAEHDRSGEVNVGALRCHGRALADLARARKDQIARDGRGR